MTLLLWSNLNVGFVLALALFALASFSFGSVPAYAGELDWPAVDSETKPWTRWWWHGSEVTERDLTVELEKLAAAGLGGVEITPIYGVRGEEAQFIPYLSPEWVDMLEHVLREAKRLGMGVDMATGNGWPFGGPWVDANAACKNLVLQTYELNGGQSLEEPVRYVQKPMVCAIGRRVNIADLKESIGENADLQGLALEQVRFEKPLPLASLVVYGEEGPPVDFTNRVGEDGRLDWQAPPGKWTLYAVFQGWHGKMVERAGPGGEGNVIDHFSRPALDAYLKNFDDAFADRDIAGLRAFFNDSYEVDDASGNADWTPRMFDEFQRRRGYNLRAHLPALFGMASDDENGRVLCDYRETISDLLLEEFTKPWTAWTHTHDAITRNQAHGSPANILDLYAASDIPETEGTDRIQFMAAASAAHITGKRLVSAEACTWLDEHFVGTLGEAKRWVDDYFLGGVNHICYHGTCYSPESEPWPGRLFYASLELQPTNPQWRHFHALNEYVARCQSFLQAGKPDNDVLVYYPIHDEWAKRGRTTLAHFSGEARGTAARRCAETALAAGYGLDFISDRQLAEVKAAEGSLRVGQATYRALIVPGSGVMPLATLKHLVALAESGAKIAVAGELPSSAAGMAGAEKDRDEFSAVADNLKELVKDGRVLQSVGSGDDAIEEVLSKLSQTGVQGELFVRSGDLSYVRRKFEDGFAYFIVDIGSEPIDDWVLLRTKAQSVVVFDPLSGEIGVAETRPAADGVEVRLQLGWDQSRILRTYDHAIAGQGYPYFYSMSDPKTPFQDPALKGPWRISFLEGGPTLPQPVDVATLESWTDLPGEDVKNFSGIARYTTEFPKPTANANGWILTLHEVHASAEVRLNGESLGTLIAEPFSVRIPAAKLRDYNTLEIDVANLMANRIADLDRRGIAWKKFYNVNFAPRRPENRGRRGLFDASKWKPLPSGLMRSVSLSPQFFETAAAEDGAQSRRQFDFEPGGAPSSFGLPAPPLPEGNYRVTVTVGDVSEASTTTIHAEVRRLLAESIPVPAGATATFTATVNVRTPRIAVGREVRLKDRERFDERVNWDDQLTLNFSGEKPSVRRIVIERDDRCPTLFLLGDSTMADQAKPPWNSWGQMLPRFFGPTIAVANHAESGESLRSAFGERRVEKIYSLLKSGDWVAVQFGHNDMKSTAPDALDRYAADLKDFVAGVRERGATPILITSMERKNGIERDTLAGYPDAVRRVAAATGAPLIDLHAMSKTLYRGLGDHLDAAFQDPTHHQDFGSYELARCVVEGLRSVVPELATHLAADAGRF